MAPSGGNDDSGMTDLTVSSCGKAESSALVEVVFAESRDPVGKAKVVIRGPSKAAGKTDTDTGTVSFAHLSPGEYSLDVTLEDTTCPDYGTSLPDPITLTKGKEKVITVEVTPPIRVLLWHIPELGGGFFRREQLPDYAIQSFAALIAGVKADICLLMGLRRQGPSRLEKKSMPDNSPYFVEGARTDGAGGKEMDRILTALKKVDSAGKWQSVFLKADDGSVAYQADCTTGVLYRTTDDLAFRAVELVRGPGSKRFGVPSRMLNAVFDYTVGGGPKKALAIVAPLGIMTGDDEAPVEGSGEEASDTTLKGDMPESCLVAISAATDLGSHISTLNGAYQSVTPDVSGLKSVPEGPKWQIILESMENLIQNPMLAAWSDPRLQDEVMSWLSENIPEHPTSPQDIKGVLSDLFLQYPKSGSVQLKKLYAVDMIRASFKKEKLTDSQRPEDAVLEALFKEYQKAMPGVLKTDFQDADASAVAASAHFARFLSEHWPVVASVTVK